MAAKSVAIRGYRSSMRPEQLETRVMLSASPSDTDATVAAHVAAASHTSRTDVELDLAITGTDIRFSPIGTPSFMAGTITFVMPDGNPSGQVGLYQETLTPIFMDVNGDAVPDFVGTNGVATFSFYAGKSHKVFLGSITTVNTSYIQGMTGDGELLVGSTGTITAADGLFKGATGGFTSGSVVALYPSFAMQTTVHFVIQDLRLNGRYAVKIAGAVVASLAESYHNKLKADFMHSLRANGERHEVADKPQKCWSHDHGSSSSAGVVDRLVERGSDHSDWWSSTRRHDRWSSDLAKCRLGVG